MSDKSIEIDASAWTGPLPTDWPKASDYPLPKPIQARERASRPIVLALILLLASAGPWLPSSQKTPGAKDIAFSTLALLGGLWLMRRGLRARTSPRVALTLDARGLMWPGGYEKTIPWDAITYAEHRLALPLAGSGVPGVHISVRDSERFGPKELGVAAALAFGPLVKLRPLPWMLDVKPRVIFATIQAYRAHHGRLSEV